MASHSSGGVIVDATDPLTAANLTAEIGSVTSVDINSNVETVADDAGNLYDESQSITQFAPVANVTSKSIAEVLSVIGVAGQCFKTTSGNIGVSIFGKNRGDCLTDVEANQHSRYLFPNGLMRLGTLQASKGSDATISIIVDGITDGTNPPLMISHAQTLPATLIRGQWEIGLCEIASVYFKPEDVTLNFGQRETKRRPLAPLVWPETIAVEKVQPTATFRGLDIKKIDTTAIDITGETALHTNTIIQLLKRRSGASYESDITEVHITFTISGLVVVTNPFSAAGQADATIDVEIRGIHDGTNVPIIIDISAAYTSTP